MKSTSPGCLDFMKFRLPEPGFHEIQVLGSLDFMKFRFGKPGFHETTLFTGPHAWVVNEVHRAVSCIVRC